MVSVNCTNVALDALDVIRRFEQLKSQRQFAGTFGFSPPRAREVLDEAAKFAAQANINNHLTSAAVQSLENEIDNLRKMLPAEEFVKPEYVHTLPTFHDVADRFGVLAFSAAIKCECG